MPHLAIMQLAPTAILADTRVLPPKGLNTSWYLDVNRVSRQTAWARPFMHHYALWLGPVLLAVAFVIAYAVAWWRHAPKASALLVLGGIGTLVALGLNQLVAHAVRELRPYRTHPHVLVLVAKANDYSFPSDHSVVAGGLTVALLLVLGGQMWQTGAPVVGVAPQGASGRAPGTVRSLAAANVLLGLFLCFARVYVGAHYPGDVVAGYLMTALVVTLVSLLRPVAYRIVDRVEPTVLGTLLRRAVPATAGGAPSAG